MEIFRIARTAFRHWYSVIDFHFVVGFAATCAFAVLLFVQTLNIFPRENAAILFFSCAVVSAVLTRSFAEKFWIVFSPASVSFVCSMFVFIAPFFNFSAMRRRIFGATFSSPRRFQPWPGFVPTLAPQSGAFYALSRLGSSRSRVAVATGIDGFIGFLSHRDGGKSLRSGRWHGPFGFVNDSNVTQMVF